MKMYKAPSLRAHQSFSEGERGISYISYQRGSSHPLRGFVMMESVMGACLRLDLSTPLREFF
ncbi:MAG: hypothetical protein K2X28_03045 [Alphaproteobacteria bacterium]|nr:hypothetical protein [Alphaproteobacteria bacterium]